MRTFYALENKFKMLKDQRSVLLQQDEEKKLKRYLTISNRDRMKLSLDCLSLCEVREKERLL